MKSVPVLQVFSIENEVILQTFCYLKGPSQIKSCLFVPQVTVQLPLHFAYWILLSKDHLLPAWRHRCALVLTKINTLRNKSKYKIWIGAVNVEKSPLEESSRAHEGCYTSPGTSKLSISIEWRQFTEAKRFPVWGDQGDIEGRSEFCFHLGQNKETGLQYLKSIPMWVVNTVTIAKLLDQSYYLNKCLRKSSTDGKGGWIYHVSQGNLIFSPLHLLICFTRMK